MAKLRRRHLLVINEYMKNGGRKKEAMLKAGYAAHSIDNNTNQVFQHPDVLKEIDRREAKEVERSGVTVAWITERLKLQADAPRILAKFKIIGDDGELFWDFTGATEDELGVILGLSTEIFKDGKGDGSRDIKKFKIDVANPMPALNALARHLNMFKEDNAVRGEVSLIDRLQQGRQRMNKENADAKG